MIKDRIGRNEVLLPINDNYNKICDVLALLKKGNTRNSKKCLASNEKKKPFKCVHAMARSFQLHRHDAHCPITLSY